MVNKEFYNLEVLDFHNPIGADNDTFFNADEPKEEKKEDKKEDKSKSVKRHFMLNENVRDTTVKEILLGILEVNRHDDEQERKNPNYRREPIELIVNTYGGSVYDGFGLVAVIDSSKTPVHTFLYGKAMSMGFLIFSAGHKRFAHALGSLMYHQISTGSQGVIQHIKYSFEQAENLEKMYDNYLLSVTSIPKELIDEHKKMQKDLYLSAFEGLQYGIVDEIITSTRR